MRIDANSENWRLATFIGTWITFWTPSYTVSMKSWKTNIDLGPRFLQCDNLEAHESKGGPFNNGKTFSKWKRDIYYFPQIENSRIIWIHQLQFQNKLIHSKNFYFFFHILMTLLGVFIKPRDAFLNVGIKLMNSFISISFIFMCFKIDYINFHWIHMKNVTFHILPCSSYRWCEY